ncbi:MAG: hypothetical protein NVSMB33_17890 [Ktedonobacteraceae bacterium]
MTGLWLASFLVLWVVVVVLCFLLIGILRQLGFIQRQLDVQPSEPQNDSSIPALELDGPTIGSPLTNLEVETINSSGHLKLTSLNEDRPLLVMFMSPLCETCQHIVEPLNALVTNVSYGIRPTVIMRGDEQMCRAFLSVFPLHMPVVCDKERTITKGFGIHHTPFGLLYDVDGTLIRKGIVGDADDLLALLGDRSAPETAQSHVFPHAMASLSTTIS